MHRMICILDLYSAAINSSGYAVTASKAESQITAGCAMRLTDNSDGSAGDVTVPVRRGVFVWKNDGTIEETDVLKSCYISDEKTVTITATGSSYAGIILGVESDGVIVD